MFRPAFNPTASPVLVDGAGRSIGGGEWGAVDTTEPRVREALNGGRLDLGPAVDSDAKLSGDADAAYQRAVVLEDRRQTLSGATVAQLRDFAGEDLDDQVDVDDARKGELVSALAHPDADLSQLGKATKPKTEPKTESKDSTTAGAPAGGQ